MGKKGKSKYHNLFKIGDKFNDWEIIGDILLVGEAKIKCRCKCGYESYISCYSIKSNTSKGCILCNGQKRKGENNSYWRGYKIIPGSFIQSYKRRSIEKKLEWDIDSEYIYLLYNKQNKKCALSGVSIDFKNYSTKKSYGCTASIDRIDSKKGYNKSNIQLVHSDVNIMKNKYDEDYFIKICRLIADNN